MSPTASIVVSVGLAAGLIAGCAPAFTGAQQPAPKRRVVFMCEGGESITIDFADDAATLIVGGSRLQLAQQPAASGIRYSGSGHELRGKGPDMVWTDSDGTAHHCRDRRSEPPHSGAGS
jgi:membrane-bound inhibitor of C-type lysozyme